MDGFGSHTFSLINAEGSLYYVKWHLKTQQGIKNLTATRAAELAGIDPDYAQRDLFETIERGDFPKWKLMLQIATEKELLDWEKGQDGIHLTLLKYGHTLTFLALTLV